MTNLQRAEEALRAAKPKLDRIQSLGESLLVDVTTWNNTHPMRTEFELDSDGHGWTWTVLGFDPEPGLEDWGVRFGEIAHHFRSLLNHTLTRIARAEGLARDHTLQFPIALTSQAWRRNELRRLQGLPERVIRAIYANQPFVMTRGHGVDPDLDVLAVLGWADNESKHEVDLVPVMAPSAFSVDRVPEFARPVAAVEEVDVEYAHDFSMATGSTLVHARYPNEVVVGPGQLDFAMEMSIAIRDSRGNLISLQVQLNEFMDKVKHILTTVLMAWDDPSVDIDAFAGSSDFKRGAAFGKAAVDGVNGEGTWDRDFLHRPRFHEVIAEHIVENAVVFGDLRGLVEPDAESE